MGGRSSPGIALCQMQQATSSFMTKATAKAGPQSPVGKQTKPKSHGLPTLAQILGKFADGAPVLEPGSRQDPRGHAGRIYAGNVAQAGA